MPTMPLSNLDQKLIPTAWRTRITLAEMLVMPLMVMTLVMTPVTNSTHLTMACSSVRLTKTMTSSQNTVPCRKGPAGGWTAAMLLISMENTIRVILHPSLFIGDGLPSKIHQYYSCRNLFADVWFLSSQVASTQRRTHSRDMTTASSGPRGTVAGILWRRPPWRSFPSTESLLEGRKAVPSNLEAWETFKDLTKALPIVLSFHFIFVKQ